jgi:hypothetical protein
VASKKNVEEFTCCMDQYNEAYLHTHTYVARRRKREEPKKVKLCLLRHGQQKKMIEKIRHERFKLVCKFSLYNLLN